ncbi:MAG: 3-oxoacyl-ACP reductase FabG [Caldilineaceae bacterium SB0670_bin_27]|uniref:3-oxoacyl-ACP reductase FabG n=1 Tax=Caldilineaceae bacterium SB0664_bin_27 TaxID=2605260 RepID=A0A6B0YX80_9CHLR|nr:3-oxoacyl-ACP reductase FabG [Caldilineaceae bacterium SB0664_bin_27]MYJ77336.1 3-oxoacyl-ACP reductase FabG [Caldilineaceae bacterium SB0670_bin_27]
MFNLKGKVAFITGAGGEQGIGRSIALRLAEDGADVVVTDIVMKPYADADWGGLPALKAEIEALGRRSLALTCDITDGDAVEAAMQQTIETFGRIDILVNNAGARGGGDLVPVVDLPQHEWDRVMSVNLNGTFICSQAAARQMMALGGGGRIISVSSVAGLRGIARFAAYCSSKFAIIGLTQSLALELAAHGITVNAICPSLTPTERIGYMTNLFDNSALQGKEATDALLSGVAGSTPVGRLAQTEDLAHTVSFLASDGAAFLTGLSIPVDGGWLMR